MPTPQTAAPSMAESGLDRQETSSLHPKIDNIQPAGSIGGAEAAGAESGVTGGAYGTLEADDSTESDEQDAAAEPAHTASYMRAGGEGQAEVTAQRPVAENHTYVFSSLPSTPKDKPADILIRFQAVSRENPAVEVKAVYISSRCTLLETRRILHKFFSTTYDRGFIFLHRGREVVRNKERSLRLLDVMPRLPLGLPTYFFKYPDVQYKKLAVEREGRRVLELYAGIVFLCEKSPHERWQPGKLHRELCGDNISGFTFVPANIMSAGAQPWDSSSHVDTICELAGLGETGRLVAGLNSLPSEITCESFRDRDLATPLHRACASGHVTAAEAIVGRLGRETVYIRDVYGRTPLHCAIYNHRLEVVSFLLHLGADIRVKDELGFSCHRLIKLLGREDSMFLLSRLEPRVLESSLVLHFLECALEVRDLELCRRLCELVDPVEAPFFRPPLHQAAELGDEVMVERLLQPRPSPRVVYDKEYCDTISIASIEAYRPRTSSAAARGARQSVSCAADDVDILTHRENYVRIETLERKTPELKDQLDVISDLDVLLDDVSDTTHHRRDTPDANGHLAFHYACQHGHTGLVDVLYYSDMSHEDFTKGLRLALLWRRYQAAHMLMALRPDLVVDRDILAIVVKEIDKSLGTIGRFLLPVLRQSPILLTRFVSQAAAENDTNILSLLLNLNVPMTGEDIMKRTPLHEACQQGHEAACRFLLTHNASPGARDWRGSTPLHYACAAHRLDVVTVLAARDPDSLAALDCRLRTPALRAAQTKSRDVLLYLVAEHSSRIDLLRHDANGDCVLNYLADFDEDFFNIVLDAAARQKQTAMQSRDVNSALPRDHHLEAEVLEAWTDPSLSPAPCADERAGLTRRRAARTAYRVLCRACHKSFTTLSATQRWSHLCRSKSQNTGEAVQRIKTTTPVTHSKNGKDSENKKFQFSTFNLPLRSSKETAPVLSPLDVVIIKRKHALIPRILEAFPEYGKHDRTPCFAAKALNVEALKALHSASNFSKDVFTNLLHVALLQATPSTEARKQQARTASFLLRMGASPNYIPGRGAYDMSMFTVTEMKLFHFMPLELAALASHTELVELLLEYGASASICFAVHIAAVLGDIAMMQKLLPLWREGRWKSYIKGFQGDANELVRVCTLESGLVQAVCAARNCSLELLRMVKDDEKGVFCCRKVLTHHMVVQIRPHICQMTSPTIMNRILYKHAEDVKRGEEICQHLYMTNLLLCSVKHLPPDVVDELASFLTDNDCYTGEIRVSKKSTIHVVCEAFVVAVKRRMWRTAESLLKRAGNTLWKCLVSPHHSCHKYAYAAWGGEGLPCLSSGIISLLRAMPLDLLKIFFDLGKKLMERQDISGIRDKITADVSDLNTEVNGTTAEPGGGEEQPGASEKKPPGGCIMKHVVLYYIRTIHSSKDMKGRLLVLSKLAILFPETFPVSVETVRFSPARHTWFSSTLAELQAQQRAEYSSPGRLIKQLRQERLEIRLWTLVATLPTRDVTAVQERALTLLHLACMQNDLKLAGACLTMVSPLDVNAADSTGMRAMDVAACRGNLKLLDLLHSHGGAGGPSVLIAACVGKAYLAGLQSAAAAKAKDSEQLQKTKCATMHWLFKNMRKNLNLGYRHPVHGSMFDVMLVRQCWTLLQWTLEHAGAEACAAVMAKSQHLAGLALAPEDLLRTIGHSYALILEKMAVDSWRRLLLALSAFPLSGVAEYMLKKAAALRVMANHSSVVKILAYKGSHGETLLHNACRCGNTSLVKTVITMAGNTDLSRKEVIAIIDTPDKTSRTPLWYSLAFRYWKLAEFLIVNGAQSPLKRSVPGLWNKRLFQELAQRMTTPPQPTTRALVQQAQMRRSNSSQMSEIVSPAAVIFRDLYLDDLAAASPPKGRDADPKLKQSSTDKKAPVIKTGGKAKGKPKAPETKLVQDDMESVGHLLTPRTPRSARTVRPALQADSEDTVVVTMSPRLHYPDDDEDLALAKENVHKKKRVRYLLSLLHFANINHGNLLHAACSYGNALLVKGITSAALWSGQRSERKIFSPFIYAMANNSVDVVEFCLKNNLGPFEADPFVDVLCFVIMNKYGFEPSHKSLKKLLNRFTIAKETIRGIKLMLLPRTQGMLRLWRRGVRLDAQKDAFSEDFISELIKLAIKHNKGTVGGRLLMTLAVTGRTVILNAILAAVEDSNKIIDVLKEKCVHNANIVDLMFLLAPSRITPEQREAEYAERMQILNTISEFIRLDIAARTLSAAVKKNLIPMLELVVKDHTRNGQPLHPSELWYDAIFRATIQGDLNFINTVCMAEINTKPQSIQAAMLKALCLSCLKRQRAIANRLLLFKMPLSYRVDAVTTRYPNMPRLTLECAIEGGDSVIASLILQTMEDTGMYPKPDDILSCIALAFDRGMEPIADNLLKFAHTASPALVTLKICHMLFLSSARRGNGMVCAKFLGLPDFNVVAMDNDGFTALHYACIHGKSSLAREIIAISDRAVHMTTPEGWTPLDLARGFGHTEMAVELISYFGAVQGSGFGIIVSQSWLRRLLSVNALQNSGESRDLSPARANIRGLDIVSLVKQGNDKAARSLLEVAQESIVACVLFAYNRFPLLHLCAASGCTRTLSILIQLISAQQKMDIKEYMLKEIKGKIPLCIAVENINIECVRMLKEVFMPVEWRFEPTGESILHFAARTNHQEIIELLTAGASLEFLQVQDKDGLIPASTAIALGNHSNIGSFLQGLRFAEKLHHDHTTTEYWCVLCLLDCCIGWSKIFLTNTEINLNGKGRNIFQRHRTESGFCVYAHHGNTANTGHVLDNIHRWLVKGADEKLQGAALATMQYSTNGYKSDLFLLLSRMTRHEALEYFIRKGKSDVASYLYEKLCPTLDMATKVMHFINAVAYGRENLVKKILHLSGEEMATINYEGDYTALDLAVAFGHKDLLDSVSNAFETSTALTSLKFFDKAGGGGDSFLPLDIKWNLGLAKVGDPEWRASFDYRRTRLSYVDIFLLKRNTVNSFPQDLLPRDLMPLSIRGRTLEVNHRSMQAAIQELGVDDTYLTSLLVSKAVLGRYFSEPDGTSEQWRAVKKIILHCSTPSSGQGARMDLQHKDLNDIVLVRKDPNMKQGELKLQVITAEFPEQLTQFRDLRASVTDIVLPAVQDQIRAELFGLEVEVTVDWNTIDTPNPRVPHRQMLQALAGSSSAGQLAGLSAAISQCAETMRDIEVLYNRDTIQNMIAMLEPIHEIQVKYLRALPKTTDVISLPHDGRIVWHFAIEDGRPRYNTALFSLSTLVQMFHTVALCLHPSIQAFRVPNVLAKNKIRSPRHHAGKRRMSEMKTLKKKPPITLKVKWKSFLFLTRLKTLMHFVEHAIMPQMVLMGAHYTGMLRLDLDISEVLLQSVSTDEEAGLRYKDGVLQVSFHSYAVTHKPHAVSDIDALKVFNELEVTNLSKKWRTASVNVTGGRHRAVNALLDAIGFPIELPMVGQNVLEMMCRLESREMKHPYELLKLFGLALFKNIACGFIESAVLQLSFHPDSYYVGSCHGVPPGLYAWVRQFEAQPLQHQQPQHSQFLVFAKPKKNKSYQFSLMTKVKLLKQSRSSVAGVWQKISTTNCYETLRHPKLDKGQIIVINNKVFLLTSPAYVENFLGSLPEAVSVGFSARNSRTKYVSYDEVLVKPFDLYGSPPSRHVAPMVRSALTIENYNFLSWLIGLKHGFNVVFESVIPRKRRHQNQHDGCEIAAENDTQEDGDNYDKTEDQLTADQHSNNSQLTKVQASGAKATPGNPSNQDINQKPEAHVKKGEIYTRDPIKIPSPSPPIPSQVYVEYATYRTLLEVMDERLYESEDRAIISSLFSNIGSISVGAEVPDSCLELVQGEAFEECADVYLLSDRDVHVFPLGSLWQGDTAGSSYRQALLVALCNMFLQQTKSRVSSVLAQNLNRTIDPADIKFKERVTSAEQVSSLSGTHTSVRVLEKAINRILGNSSAGTRKLKMNLTGVEFSEHQSGPMVSFDAGVLRCPIFRKGSKIDQRAMDRAFLFAVDEESGRDLMGGFGPDGEAGQPREIELAMGFEDLFSVTSSERRVQLSKKENILEKQRIAKHQSEDNNVIEKAVKRLFAGVEIGRTSDIVDSLDLGANVNCLNNNSETPLVVAAKSRNYTIIDLLLTRGAAPNTADALGVSPLHYEAGQGDVEAVKLMLSYGANPNAEDFMGRTPLHYAVVGSHLETVDLLVFCGADSSMVNKDGESPKALAQTKEIRAALLETDLIIKGIKSRNVAIEHLTLQADVVYRLADTRLIIRTPSGMGLAKTSLMVRRVVPEYSYYGPQPSERELLLSDIYEFRISGAYVEEPLLLQIPVYSRAEHYEDVFVKTDKGIYSTPVRIARMVDANKEPHWICHARVCLYGIRSISLVARPRLERFLVPEAGADLRSVIDPMVRLQFRHGAVTEETEVTFQVTSKPSYEEEDYDSILSMSHFFEISSTSMKPLHNDLLVSLPLPENYLGHGILHVLMRKQGEDQAQNAREEWLELLRNPDYASDAVILRLSTWGQLCLMERNPQYPVRHDLGPGGEVVQMVSSLHEKTRRREYSTCFLAMARPKPGAGAGVAEVVVECVVSSRIHARLHHWGTEGYIDLKPSHTMEFATIPKQAFVIGAGGRCAIQGLPLPPLQFHPKRNNCAHFIVLPRDLKGSEEGHIEILLRIPAADSKPSQISFSVESVHTATTTNLTAAQPAQTVSKAPLHHQSRDTLQLTRDQLLARIPLFLPWTAPPDDPRGQDTSDKVNLSPFDTDLSKADLRGESMVATENQQKQNEKTQLQQQQQQLKKPPQDAPSGKQAAAQTKGKPAAKSVKEKQTTAATVRATNTTASGASKQQQQQKQQQQKPSSTALSKQGKAAALTTGPVLGTGRPHQVGLILQPGAAARPRSGKPESSKSMVAKPEKTSPRPQSAPKSSPTAKSRTSSSAPLQQASPSLGTGIRSVTPSSATSRDGAMTRSSGGIATCLVPSATPGASGEAASRPVSAVSGAQREGVLDFLSRGLGEEWFQLGVLLGVPYPTLQVWAEDSSLSLEQRADQMLNHWKQTRRTRQDHGVPELLMSLQRIGKTQLVRALKDRLRTWISDNLEKRGFLKGVVNKNLLEDTENLEPMSPLFLLSLVRKVGFSIDFIYDLGVSRPEVTRVMTDPLLRHREDKMLGLLLVAKDKEPSADIALQKILSLLHTYDRAEAIQWTLSACRSWLVNQGCADDRFAHGVRDLLLSEATPTPVEGSDETVPC